MTKKKVIAFAGSNSKNSINKKLVVLATKQLKNVEVNLLDLNDFELPIYGIDKENKNGIPEDAKRFNKLLEDSDGILLSLAEHNGAYTVAFKNIFDWVSRIDKMVWKNKPMLLMSASPGGRGGASVMEIALGKFPRMGADIIANFSLPFFKDNYSEDKIVDEQLNTEFNKCINKFQKAL
ncbi:NAD(P)H-dependent oxidoreductase [Aureibaculum sp. 2210JD6-5]|uniref:NADPH-dependent FMN reductase n=1 Tax=Aureibaculum sp. 2210JD6-5 TaxID=3103957 RepID=UPI002AAE5820|nr:NAD(P)H-dependent oxidoreductase [Aureibaculum sp. 2210JD6-5]MDY7394173.1 NAD(P)H-dependent oxidoreductase [Aureibaculum sp. 2210JD6-5]